MIAALRTRLAGRFAALATALACATVVAASPATAHPPPSAWEEYSCAGTNPDAVAYDESHDVVKIPDAQAQLLRPPITTPVSDSLDLDFHDLPSLGYELYCIKVVADVVHPDRSDLQVEVRLPGEAAYRVVYGKGKPGPDLHLSTDRLWTQVGDVRLKITDLDRGGTGTLVYWRAEGYYRLASTPPPVEP
jgi:hypothetical protein